MCDPCPPGTITDLLGSVELSACRACDRNRVAPASGMTVCQICADAHAGTVADDRVTCRCEDDWCVRAHAPPLPGIYLTRHLPKTLW